MTETDDASGGADAPASEPLKRPPAFDGAEYARRLATVRVEMEARELDALILTDPSNMAWLTGYDGWSFYVHQAVILTRQGAPRWWGRGQDLPGARVTTWMNDGALTNYPDDLVQSPDRHPYQHLCEMLPSWGIGRARIGVELDNYYFSAACIGHLLSGASNATFMDATGLVNWARLVKSPEEIAFIRRAALIVEKAHAHIREAIAPGRRKNDLIAEVMAVLIGGAEDADGPFGGDYPAIMPMAPSGAEASAAHLTWDDRPFQAGEATFFEIAGCYRRYHCPQSRTVCLGEPSAELRRAELAALHGIDAAIRAARPGVLAEEVEGAWRDAIAQHGFVKDSRIGYSVGLSYPPDWGERTVSIRAGDRTELQENMVLHLIPALWQKDYGLEITETVLIGPGGAEPLCGTPRELFVVR